MATKTEEVLGLRKAALENDYTISDINSYNQRNTGKEVSKDLIDIYLGLAEKYNIRDNEGNRDLNWVKVMKVIEFHNQVIGTILTTEGWWLPIQTAFGKFDIRPEKLLFTIKSMNNSTMYRSEAKREKVNNLIDWYNSYIGYRQSKIRLKKNFQKFHKEIECVPDTPIMNKDMDKYKQDYEKRTIKRRATLYSYIGEKCVYGDRVGVITDIVKEIPVIYRVKFIDSPIEEAIKSKDLVIEQRVKKEIEKMKHEAKRASVLRDRYNDKIKRK
jgi:hypothetical protein